MIIFREIDYDEKRSPINRFILGKYDGRPGML